MRGADVVAQVLYEYGLDTVFALSGNQILPIFDAFLDSGIRLIHTRHEAAAAYMAEGHAQISGRPGIALVTAGAGLANAIAPLTTARASQTPLVLLSGDSPVRDDGRGAFQELPQTAITAPVTKRSVRAENPGQLADALRYALDLAQADEPGPVHVALPVDSLEANASAPGTRHAHPESEVGFDKVTAALNSADRPLILLGPALSRSRSLLEFGRLCAPAVAMESPRGANDPALGRWKAAWREADLVVALGKPIDFSVGFGARSLWPNAHWMTVHGDSREVGPIVQFVRRTTLRKNIARTPGFPAQAARFLLAPRYSGRAILRPAAPECRSKLPVRMMCSQPSGEVNGNRPGSGIRPVFPRWSVALSMQAHSGT